MSLFTNEEVGVQMLCEGAERTQGPCPTSFKSTCPKPLLETHHWCPGETLIPKPLHRYLSKEASVQKKGTVCRLSGCWLPFVLDCEGFDFPWDRGSISLRAQHSSIISAVHFWRASVPHHLPCSRPVPGPTCGWWGKAGLALPHSGKAHTWLQTIGCPLWVLSPSPL